MFVPKTLIYGHGFESLTYIYNEDRYVAFKEINLCDIEDILVNFSHENRIFPFGIHKTEEETNLILNLNHALKLIENLYSKKTEFSFQEYITSDSDYAQIIRVTKDISNKIISKVLRNRYPYPISRVNSLSLNPSLNFLLTFIDPEGCANRTLQKMKKNFVILTGFQTGEFTLSISTIDLVHSID